MDGVREKGDRGREVWRSLIAALILTVLIGVHGILTPDRLAARIPGDTCQLDARFQSLRSALGDAVGACVEDPQRSLVNGDILQPTTTGLFVWRQSDLVSAYTDGYRTWLAGPDGIQARLNSQRFSWETTSTCIPSSHAIEFSSLSDSGDGGTTLQGTVTNGCLRSLNVTVDVLADDPTDGSPRMDGATSYLTDLAPASSWTFQVDLPLTSPRAAVVGRAFWFAGTDFRCVDVGATKCLLVDPWLGSSVDTLRQDDVGNALLRQAAEFEVRVLRQQTEPGVFGMYDPLTRTITVDTRLDAYSSWVRAAVLAHELQHAVDDSSGHWPTTRSECYAREEDSFRVMASIWSHLWQGNLPGEPDIPHQLLNGITRAGDRDPFGFAVSLLGPYQNECQAYLEDPLR